MMSLPFLAECFRVTFVCRRDAIRRSKSLIMVDSLSEVTALEVVGVFCMPAYAFRTRSSV